MCHVEKSLSNLCAQNVKIMMQQIFSKFLGYCFLQREVLSMKKSKSEKFGANSLDSKRFDDKED